MDFQEDHPLRIQLVPPTGTRNWSTAIAFTCAMLVGCAFLGRRDGDDSVHLLRAHGNERVSVTTQPGSRRLLPETGMGKALLIDDDDENAVATTTKNKQTPHSAETDKSASDDKNKTNQKKNRREIIVRAPQRAAACSFRGHLLRAT